MTTQYAGTRLRSLVFTSLGHFINDGEGFLVPSRVGLRWLKGGLFLPVFGVAAGVIGTLLSLSSKSKSGDLDA